MKTKVEHPIDVVSVMINGTGYISMFIHRGNDYCENYDANETKANYKREAARILQFALAYAARLPGAVEKKERKQQEE